MDWLGVNPVSPKALFPEAGDDLMHLVVGTLEGERTTRLVSYALLQGFQPPGTGNGCYNSQFCIRLFCRLGVWFRHSFL